MPLISPLMPVPHLPCNLQKKTYILGDLPCEKKTQVKQKSKAVGCRTFVD